MKFFSILILVGFQTTALFSKTIKFQAGYDYQRVSLSDTETKEFYRDLLVKDLKCLTSAINETGSVKKCIKYTDKSGAYLGLDDIRRAWLLENLLANSNKEFGIKTKNLFTDDIEIKSYGMDECQTKDKFKNKVDQLVCAYEIDVELKKSKNTI